MKKKTLTAKAQAEKIFQLARVRYSKINKTLPVILRRIKHKKKRCEDCSFSVKDRRVEATCVFKPKKHWLQKCMNCDLFLDRHTGKYTLDWQQAHNRAITDMGYYSSDEYHNLIEKRHKRRLEIARQANERYRNKLKALKSAQNPEHTDK